MIVVAPCQRWRRTGAVLEPCFQNGTASGDHRDQPAAAVAAELTMQKQATQQPMELVRLASLLPLAGAQLRDTAWQTPGGAGLGVASPAGLA
jgi:hypothetical protein